MKHILDFLFPGAESGSYTALTVILCVVFGLWLLTAIARWRTFNKMGESGWKAFIPLYGYYVIYAKCWNKTTAINYVCSVIISAFFEAGIYKGTTELTATLCSIGELIVAIELLYLTVRINFRMAKAFGHGFWFGLGLWLFPFIFTFVLGFGKSEYIGNPEQNGK